MGKLESRIDFRLRGYARCLKTIARFSLDLKDNRCINGEAVTMLGNSGRPGVCTGGIVVLFIAIRNVT
jgi:hypothetical protein